MTVQNPIIGLISQNSDVGNCAARAVVELGCELRPMADAAVLLDKEGGAELDLLILDQSHPGATAVIDGLLDSSRGFPGELPCLVLIQDANDAMLKKILRYGFVDFIKAPCESTLMKLRIRQLLENTRLASHMRHARFQDSVTGLPNRFSLLDRLDAALHRAARERQRCALIYLDLDQFRWINETYEYDFGDLVLQMVAERLLRVLPASATAARLGGDEFVIMLEHLESNKDLLALVDSLRLSINHPLWFGGQEVRLTASMGVATYPEDGKGSQALLGHAEIALRKARERGHDQMAFYRSHMRHSVERRLSMLTDLRKALAEDAFTVVYQPQYCLSSGEMIGMEALVRWQMSDGTLVSPLRFLPVAEETGVVKDLDFLVLRKVCLQLRQWLDRGLRVPPVAVNFSAQHFHSDDLPNRIGNRLSDYAIPPRQIVIEITETVMLADPRRAAAILNMLKKLGVGISLDDFGTGYSSMSYLRKLPVDSMKIDRTFLQSVPGSHADECIIEGFMALARGFGLKVVAEGVEHAAQIAFLEQHGCHYGQGFHFSRPVPAESIQALLKRTSDAGFSF